MASASPASIAVRKASSTRASAAALAAVIDECGADGAGFPPFAEREGRSQLAAIRDEAEAAGVFGVPSFLLEDGDLYWGREHLARIRELLAAA